MVDTLNDNLFYEVVESIVIGKLLAQFEQLINEIYFDELFQGYLSFHIDK